MIAEQERTNPTGRDPDQLPLALKQLLSSHPLRVRPVPDLDPLRLAHDLGIVLPFGHDALQVAYERPTAISLQESSRW